MQDIDRRIDHALSNPNYWQLSQLWQECSDEEEWRWDNVGGLHTDVWQARLKRIEAVLWPMSTQIEVYFTTAAQNNRKRAALSAFGVDEHPLMDRSAYHAWDLF